MQHKAFSALLALAVLMSGFGFAFAGFGTAQDAESKNPNPIDPPDDFDTCEVTQTCDIDMHDDASYDDGDDGVDMPWDGVDAPEYRDGSVKR